MESLKDVLSQLAFPISNLIDEIADWRNIYDSFDYVVGHLECAQQRDNIRPKREAYCRQLHYLLSTGKFRIGADDFRTMVVTDGPKDRIVQCPSVFHRIGCHAVMVPFEKYAYATLIDNTAASIKHRGMHWLHDVIEEDLLADPENTLYYYQCDIHHYYDSISQEKMKEQIREYTTDPVALPMLDNFVELLPEGLSKGLRASQCNANLHLSDVDHEMCKVVPFHKVVVENDTLGKEFDEVFGVSCRREEIRYHYYRYCDDIVIIGNDKKELWKMRDHLVAQLSKLGLTIKPNEAIRPLTSGLDYLGYVTFIDDSKVERAVYSRIRKRTKQKFARRLKRVKSKKRRQSLIGSFFGMAAHADCRHLLRKLITIQEFNRLKHKRKMKDFSNFNVKPTTFNGKKSFKGDRVSCSELDHKGVIIIDYEKGVIPRREQDDYDRRVLAATAQGSDPNFVPKPKTRTLVSLIHEGRMRKLWTGDKEITQILEQIDNEDGFPFFVGIEVDYTGQHKKLNFVPAAKFNLNLPSDEELKRYEQIFNIKLLK